MLLISAPACRAHCQTPMSPAPPASTTLAHPSPLSHPAPLCDSQTPPAHIPFVQVVGSTCVFDHAPIMCCVCFPNTAQHPSHLDKPRPAIQVQVAILHVPKIGKRTHHILLLRLFVHPRHKHHPPLYRCGDECCSSVVVEFTVCMSHPPRTFCRPLVAGQRVVLGIMDARVLSLLPKPTSLKGGWPFVAAECQVYVFAYTLSHTHLLLFG